MPRDESGGGSCGPDNPGCESRGDSHDRSDRSFDHEFGRDHDYSKDVCREPPQNHDFVNESRAEHDFSRSEMPRCDVSVGDCWEKNGKEYCLRENELGVVEIRGANRCVDRTTFVSRAAEAICNEASNRAERVCSSLPFDFAKETCMGAAKAAVEMCRASDAIVMTGCLPDSCIHSSELYDESTGKRYDHYYHSVGVCEAMRAGPGSSVGTFGPATLHELANIGSAAKECAMAPFKDGSGCKMANEIRDSKRDMGVNISSARESMSKPGTRCSELARPFKPALFEKKR